MKLSGKSVFRRTGLAVLGVALVVAVAFVTLRTGPLAPVKVQVVTLKRGKVQQDIFGIGQVEARRAWTLGPTTAGRVLDVRVDVGDVVEAGQVLAAMDAVDLRERLQAIDATLARARSAREASRSQVLDMQARQKVAAANLKRNEELASQQFISAGALDARAQELSSANASVQTAQANLSGSEQELLRLQAERAALLQQQDKLQLLAPAKAIVASREAEAGSTVVAGQPVLRLIDPASLWVRLRVDQGRSEGLSEGLPAEVRLRSRPGQALQGKVQRVEPVADSVTEERLAMVAFSQVLEDISVGEMAEVTLSLPESAEGWVLPNAALQQRGGEQGVWRLGGADDNQGAKDNSTLSFVPVRVTAQSLNGELVVEPKEDARLNEGDRVVRYSQKALTPEARITVVEQLLPAAGGSQ